MICRSYLLIGGALLLFSAQAADFEKEVAPLLEGRCLSCHDADHAKGDLDLSSLATALQHEDAIILKKPGDSLLLKMVSGDKPKMPKRGDHLTADEVRVLREWLVAGAPWPAGRKLVNNPRKDLNWWSLQPIRRPPVPGSPGANPVDAFINRGLQAKGLTAQPRAPAEVLIRRVTYDLTGLPPTAAETDAFFAADLINAEQAWAAVVERLLADPGFGEKWGQHWLDVARYGETHGYDKDKIRDNAWPYRDYVIRAFNTDKPYDRFVQEQVAGDALFPNTEDGIVGLGFLAAGPWDFIGHVEVGEQKVDGQIAKNLDRDEMVTAVFNTFQSTTVQCARCHHHKFDPIRMEDYYRLQAVLSAVDRADRVYAGISPAQQQEKDTLQQKLNGLNRQKSELDSELNRTIEAATAGINHRLAELKEKYGSPLQPQYGWHSQIAAEQDLEKWVQVDLGEPRFIDEVQLIPAYDQFNNIGSGFGFPVRYRVEAGNDPGFEEGVRLIHDAGTVDQANPGLTTLAFDVGGTAVRYLRVTASKLALRKNDYIFALAELEAIGNIDQNLALGKPVSSKDSIEAPPRWGARNLTDGIYYRALSSPVAVEEMVHLEKQKAELAAAIRTPDKQAHLDTLAKEIADLNRQLAVFPTGKRVYAASSSFNNNGQFHATNGKVRAVHLLRRGDVRAPAERLGPGAPALWPSAVERFADDEEWAEQDGRAALARYLTDVDNPLLWRSIVNRLWQWSFGQGLVATPNDFGRMGLPPTHPELLDYLAAELRDDRAHSLKRIVRLLVTSQAYRRSSSTSFQNAEIDGNNVFLWRTNRRRLTAEEFRDSTLQAAGVLNRDIGGASFRDFIVEKPEHSPHYRYDLYDPASAAGQRRTIYRLVVRSQPQPLLTTLDCADPSMSVPQRDESTTALQALAQWNNRLVDAMCQTFAKRLLAAAPGPDAQLDLACSWTLCRPPTAQERPILRDQLSTHGAAALARILYNMSAFTYVD